MNILIVLANYIPVQNPNVLRWREIANYWGARGHKVFILTTKYYGCPSIEKLKEVEVYRTGFATLKDFLYSKLGKPLERTVPSVKTHRISWNSRLIEKIIDLTWRKFYWPDGSRLFVKPGKELGCKVAREKNIDFLISVGLPFSCHLIAEAIKSEHPNIHWHMDIEDPFCYSDKFWVNNQSLYSDKNFKAEQKAFATANSISLTNKEALIKYGDYIHEDHIQKARIIPPLLRQVESKEVIELDQSKLHFAYFGSFYENVRSPERILECLDYICQNNLAWLEGKCFHFFGQQNKFSLTVFNKFRHLKDNLKIHPFIEADLAINQMKQADFLIHIGNTTSYHLPSKVVEYLDAKTPIINFKATKDDSFEKFSGGVKSVLHIDPSISPNEVFRMIRIFTESDINTIAFDNSNYHVEKISNQYLECYSPESII